MRKYTVEKAVEITVQDNQVKFFFQSYTEQFGKVRAYRKTASRFGLSQSVVKESAKYWS